MKKYLTLKKTAHVNIFDHFIHLYLTKNIKKSKYIIGIFGDISGIISKVLKTKKSLRKKIFKKKKKKILMLQNKGDEESG